MKRIYFDYAASTPIKREVLDEMNKYHLEFFGNASSTHFYGRENKNSLNLARKSVADCINAKMHEIAFTSGGTEADNLAIKGIARAYAYKGRHIISSCIEHKAVLKSLESLSEQGFEITYLPVDEFGFVNAEDLADAIREDTTLVSIMHINNEIGTMQDIAKLGRICRDRAVIFHSDAVQSFGNARIDVEDFCVDALSISGHKVYGPKGVGALYLRQGIKLKPIIEGGSQENGRRAGTENVPAIMGLAKAAELSHSNLDEHIKRLEKLRDYTLGRICSKIEGVKYNGHDSKRHCGNISLSFKGLDSSAILIALDRAGIAISAGSACSSGSIEPSHVLQAIGLSEEYSKGSIRISLGDFVSREDCDYLVENLVSVVKLLNKKKDV